MTEKKAEGMSQQLLARLVMIVAAVGLVMAFFLPWASAGEGFRDAAASFPDVMFYEPAGVTVADATDLSLLEYAGVYAAMGENTAWLIYAVIMYAILIVSAITVLLAALGKPIGATLVGALAFAGSRLLVWDFGDRGALPSSTHGWGIAPTIYVAAFMVLVAASVWMLLLKRGARQQGSQKEVSA